MLGKISTMICLKLRTKSNWIGHFLDILTDVLLPIKFLLSIFCFLKFFERRDVFRFLIQKKVQGKNEVTRNLSSSVITKFNGYEVIRQDVACKEREDIAPINIVYEPKFDENIPVPCFFMDQIYLAYRSYVGRFEKGEEGISNCVVK